MTRDEFKKSVEAALAAYLSDEEGYDDNPQLTVDPETLQVAVSDGDEEISDALDQYDLIDLLSMGSEGHWQTDEAQTEALVDSYFTE